MAELDIGSVFGGFDIGIGTLGNVLLVFFLAILILGLAGAGIFMYINNKKFKYIIPLYKKIGGTPIKIGVYKAKDYKIGNAGDKLWFVRKVKKFISPATIQTAPNEYSHFEREDGEWINFGLGDIDEMFKTAGVKYIHQDMRATRIAIGELMDLRFKDKKGFWEKYGQMIMNVVFYLIVAIAMVVIFYQWSDIVEKTSVLMDKIVQLEEQRKVSGGGGVVPAFMFIIGGFKKWVFSKH